ncbi:uncharacterized protein LOC135693218 isoform X3 [Rhopilema esculentum]|uniref:uncharacterized protein LOC135693218 isoform X3 n=1 Tax=Rhopilema esculentum TaxID=499914 RepID=UPI0031D3A6C0|eukprot:gene10814-19623_t
MEAPGNYEPRPPKPPSTGQPGPPPMVAAQGPGSQARNPFGMQGKGHNPYSKINSFGPPNPMQNVRMPHGPPFPPTPHSMFNPSPIVSPTYSSADAANGPYLAGAPPSSGVMLPNMKTQQPAERMPMSGDQISRNFMPQGAGSLSWPGSPDEGQSSSYAHASLPPSLSQREMKPFEPQYDKQLGTAHNNQNRNYNNTAIENISSAFNYLSLDSPQGVSLHQRDSLAAQQRTDDYEDEDTDESDETSSDNESDDGIDSDDDLLSSPDETQSNQQSIFRGPKGVLAPQLQQKTLLQKANDKAITDSFGDGQQSNAKAASDNPKGAINSVTSNVSHQQMSFLPPASQGDVCDSFTSNEPFNLFAKKEADPIHVQSAEAGQYYTNYSAQQQGLVKGFEKQQLGDQDHPSAFAAVKPSKVTEQASHSNFSADSLEKSGFGAEEAKTVSTRADVSAMLNSSIPQANPLFNSSATSSSNLLNDPHRYTEDEPSLILDPRSHEMGSTSNELDRSQSIPQQHHVRKDYPKSKENFPSRGSYSSLSPSRERHPFDVDERSKEVDDRSSSDLSSGGSSKSVIDRTKMAAAGGDLPQVFGAKDNIHGIEFNPQSESSPAHSAKKFSDVSKKDDSGMAAHSFEHGLQSSSFDNQNVDSPQNIQDINPLNKQAVSDKYPSSSKAMFPGQYDFLSQSSSSQSMQFTPSSSTSQVYPFQTHPTLSSSGNQGYSETLPQYNTADFQPSTVSASNSASENRYKTDVAPARNDFGIRLISSQRNVTNDRSPNDADILKKFSDDKNPSSVSQNTHNYVPGQEEEHVNKTLHNEVAFAGNQPIIGHEKQIIDSHQGSFSQPGYSSQQNVLNPGNQPAPHRQFSSQAEQVPSGTEESFRNVLPHSRPTQKDNLPNFSQETNQISLQPQHVPTQQARTPESFENQPVQMEQLHNKQLQGIMHDSESKSSPHVLQQNSFPQDTSSYKEEPQHRYPDPKNQQFSQQPQLQRQLQNQHVLDEKQDLNQSQQLHPQPQNAHLSHREQNMQQEQHLSQPLAAQQQDLQRTQHQQHIQQQQRQLSQLQQPQVSQQQQQQQQPQLLQQQQPQSFQEQQHEQFSQLQQPQVSQQKQQQPQLLQQQQQPQSFHEQQHEQFSRQQPPQVSQQQEQPQRFQKQQPQSLQEQQREQFSQQQHPQVSQQQQQHQPQLFQQQQAQSLLEQQQPQVSQQQQFPHTQQNQFNQLPQQQLAQQQQQQPQQPQQQQQFPMQSNQQPLSYQQQHQPFPQQQQQFNQQQQPFSQHQQLPYGQQQQPQFSQSQQFGQQQYGSQYYSHQQGQQEPNVDQRFANMSPAAPMQPPYSGYQDPNQMQGWNSQYGNYMQNYNLDYYNWYFSNMANWGYPGYGYPGYPGMNWDTRSQHSDQLSYRSSTNSEVDVDSRPSSVIDNKPLDDYEIETLAMGKKEISTFEKTTPEPVERLTPLHFFKPHVTAKLTNAGSCIITNPNDPIEGQVPSLLCIPSKNLYSITDYLEFPGPLIREDSSKKKVIMFAKKRAKHWLSSTEMKKDYCDSMALLWEYMAMLVKHNGVFDGPDVAEMLMQHKASIGSQQEEDMLGLHASEETTKISKKAALQQYREYLIQGSRKEALDFAMNHDLWGHALTLSYKMDHKLHHVVMSRLIASLEDDDSLVSLYGHLGGRGLPLQSCHAVKNGTADWREHLAMLIANPTKNKDRDKKDILSLGDALRVQGNIGGAHLCYILSNVRISPLTEDATRICLLGEDHSNLENISRPDLWAKNECLQLTEMYEYALWLRSKDFYIPSLQSMKLIYINRLSEAGMLAEAHSYCESIAHILLENSLSFYHEQSFITLFAKAFERLQYQSMESYDDPISELYLKIAELRDRDRSNDAAYEAAAAKANLVPRPISPPETPDSMSRETPSQASQDYNEQSKDSAELPTGLNQQQVNPQAENQPQPDQNEDNDPLNKGGDASHWQNESASQWPSEEVTGSNAQFWQPDQADGTFYNQSQVNYEEYNEQYPSQTEAGNAADQSNAQWSGDGYQQQGYDGQYQPDETQMQQPVGTDQQYQGNQFAGNAEGQQFGQFFNPGQYQQQGYMPQPDGFGSGYPYQMDPTAQPTFEPNINTANTDPNHAEEAEEEESLFNEIAKKNARIEKKEGAVDKENKDEKKEVKKPAEKRGWLPSFLGRLTGGRKEADLPDDTDKSIYFDEKKGKWVDKNATDESVAPPPPPPTDSQITAPALKPKLPPSNFESLPASNTFPSPVMNRRPNASDSNLVAGSKEDEPKMPTAPSKFSRTAHGMNRRGHRYVNSFGSINKSDSTDSPPVPAMFNPIGMPQQAPVNFFVPQNPDETQDSDVNGSSTQGNEQQQQPQQQQQQQQQPNQYFQHQPNQANQQQQPMEQAAQQQSSQQPPQQPAFFNPANMPQTRTMNQRSRFRR